MPSRTRSTRTENFRQVGFGYTLIAPQVIGFALFVVYPLVEVFRLSLFRVNALTGEEAFIGLDNFARMFADQDTPRIIVNTLFLAVILSISETVVALALAVLLNQRLPGINFFRAAIFIPALVTMVAWTIVWGFILQPQGLLDWVGSLVGMAPVDWLRTDWLTLVVLAFIQMLKNIGLYMMIFLAALQSVPAELVDASKVDGANSWRTFRHVVIPQISPSILMVFMLTVVGAFKVFDVIYILTRGGPGVSTTVLSYAVYKAFAQNDIGYASAFAVLLFVLIVVISAIIWQLRRRFVFHESE
jgi:multiple sugar transport system permease protein